MARILILDLSSFQFKENVGRVYIFENDRGTFAQRKILSPTELSPNSRFGYVVSNLGDIDVDGFEDFAVGAPSLGTVFVYHSDPDFMFGKEICIGEKFECYSFYLALQKEHLRNLWLKILL